MILTPGHLFTASWLGWAASWIAAAAWTAPTVKRGKRSAAWRLRISAILATLLIVLPVDKWLHLPRLWSVGETGAWILAVLTIPCFAFVWWARIHLGRLWSGALTRKEGHRLIDTGPYAVVRHPIYAGLGAAVLCSVLATGTLPALLAFVLICGMIWQRAQTEERFLSQELGAELYASYRRRVPMLIPLGPKAL